MAVYPQTLPTTTMPDASPTRKMFKSHVLAQPNIQQTATSQSGDLAFLRRQGISRVSFSNQRKSKV